MAGSSGNPSLTLLVGGSTHDLLSNRVRLHSLVPYSARQAPTLTWTVRGGALAAAPDPYLGKSIELRGDEGAGDYTLFKGTCEDLTPTAFGPMGWTRSYVARGLRDLADRLVPVTSPLDGTDAITFNRPFDDRFYDPALAGMTVGEMLRYVLEGSAIVAGLAAVGVGGYTSSGGRGATASASLSAGHVTATVQQGGSGYSSGSPPSAVLVGGNGTYTSCTVTVNGSGVVTGVTVTGSAGYTTPPAIWISPLSAATLRDLTSTGLSLIPPYPVTVQGDGVLQAIEGCLRQNCKNHRLHVGPDGVVRVFDLRVAEATPTTLTLNSTNPADPIADVGRISLARSTISCYGRVLVRGGPDVVAQLFSTADGTLERYYAHDGLTNDQAEAAWTLADYTDPSTGNALSTGAAEFTAQVSGGSVTQLTMTSAGSNYVPQSTYALSFAGGGGTGARGEFVTDDAGSAAVWRVLAGGTGYTTAPTVTAPYPKLSGGNVDAGTITNCTTLEVTVQSGDAARTWPPDYWAWTPGNRFGTIFLRSSVATGVNQLYSARIVGHPALAAGGTCVLTLDRTLPITTYSTYRIVGAAGGASEVYRRYRPTDAVVRGKLMTYFPFPQAMAVSGGAGGLAVAMTSYPTALLKKSGGSIAAITMGVTTDALGGSYLLDKPSVVPFSTPSKLREGGSAVDGKPDDVEVFGAVRVGNLQAIAPANSGEDPQYTGTGNAVEGLQRTMTVTTPDWIDRGNQANMDRFAADLLDSVKDAVVEGIVPLLGWHADWLRTPDGAIALASAYPSPWAGIPLPVTECELTFRTEPGEVYRLDLRVSNRRGVVNAAIYERPTPQGGFLSDMAETFAMPAPSPFAELGPAVAAPGEGAGIPHVVEGGPVANPAASGLTPSPRTETPWDWLG